MQEKLTATTGHVLTNGEIYGTEIYLGQGMDANQFYEITTQEYQAKLDANEPTEERVD